MSIKLYVPGSMRNIAKGKHFFEVNGKTVGECLNQVVNLIPKVKEVLFYEVGEILALRSSIKVLVNDADAEGLAKEVKSGDEIYIKIKIQ